MMKTSGASERAEEGTPERWRPPPLPAVAPAEQDKICSAGPNVYREPGWALAIEIPPPPSILALQPLIVTLEIVRASALTAERAPPLVCAAHAFTSTSDSVTLLLPRIATAPPLVPDEQPVKLPFLIATALPSITTHPPSVVFAAPLENVVLLMVWGEELAKRASEPPLPPAMSPMNNEKRTK